MEELQEALQSILSDPEQMARVTALAESLGLKPPEGEATGNRQQATGETSGSASGAAATSPARRGGGPASRPVEGCFPTEASLLGEEGINLENVMSLLSDSGGGETRVLSALRPVLSAEGQGRVDRALRAAKLSRLAGSLLTQRGPEHV